jgi:hypothetical protein
MRNVTITITNEDGEILDRETIEIADGLTVISATARKAPDAMSDADLQIGSAE